MKVLGTESLGELEIREVRHGRLSPAAKLEILNFLSSGSEAAAGRFVAFFSSKVYKSFHFFRLTTAAVRSLPLWDEDRAAAAC